LEWENEDKEERSLIKIFEKEEYVRNRAVETHNQIS